VLSLFIRQTAGQFVEKVSFVDNANVCLY